MINREDMLELTRRMTPARTCFDRIAGAYINDLGEVEDSFNVHFGKLSGGEKSRNLTLAKAIPFAIDNPCPNEPLVISTPGSFPRDGCPCKPL